MSRKYHPLTEWALEQQKKWKGLKETDKEALEILKEYNKRIGTKFNPSDHWSAITIENARMAANGFTSVEEAKKAGVNLSHKSHSGYVNDGFKAVQDPDYKYNKYISERIDDSEIKIGDYLVGGREGTKNWKFEDFEKAAKNNSGYASHGSAVVFKGIDNNGEYVILADGNWSDSYANRKVYVKDLAGKGYAVKVTDTKPPVTEAVSSEEKDWSPLDISIARDENDLKTNLEDKDVIVDGDVIVDDDEDVIDVTDTEEIVQTGYSQPKSRNKFRLSDSDQMALFGSIIYPATSQPSAKQIVSNYTGGQGEEQDADEKWQPKPADVSNEINETLDSDTPSDTSSDTSSEQFEEDLENPFENLDAAQSGSTDEKTYGSWRDMTEDRARKLYGRGSYKKDPYISYLDGDMTKLEYQKYLRTTSEFKKDYDKLITTGTKNLNALATKVSKNKYGFTDANFNKIKQPYIDFAEKYGYDPETLLTKGTADKMANDVGSGIYNGEQLFHNTAQQTTTDKKLSIEKDLETYKEKYEAFNRLKDGFTKAGYDVDDEGNISFNGGETENTIQDIANAEKEHYVLFDFEANDFVIDESRQGELLKERENKEHDCPDGQYWIPSLNRCGDSEEEKDAWLADHWRQNHYDLYNKPQGAGNADLFWAGLLAAPATLTGTALTYATDAALEIALPAVLDPTGEFLGDAVMMGFGEPLEQVQAYEKYAAPVRNAAARYDKADGFLNGVNAFLGGDPEWWNFSKGGSIEMDLSRQDALRYAQNGYILEELHEGGEPGHDHKDPPSYEDAIQAYEDSIAAKEAYEKQYALDLKDYEKNNANAKSVYNKDLKRYNYKWDRYRDNKAYIEYLSNKFDYLPKSFDDPMLNNLGPAEWNGNSWRNDRGHRSVRNKDGKEFAHMIDETLWEKRPGSDSDDYLNRSLIFWDDASVQEKYANRKLNNVVTTDTKLYAPPSDHPEWNEFYRQYGLKDYGKNAIELYGKPTQKKPTLKDLEALEYNPPEVLERPTFADYVDPMPVIKPQPITDNNLEIIGDYDEPEELVRPTYNAWEGSRPQKFMGVKNPLRGGRRLSAGLTQKLSGYDSDAMHAEIEAAENEGRRINFEGLGKGSASSGRFQRQYNKEYDVYEEALKEQKYLNTVPRFFKDGGPFGDKQLQYVELTDEEADKYRAGGYVLEEMDEGGEPHEHPHFKELLGEGSGTFITENFQDKDGYNLALVYPNTNMKRRPTRFGYDDYDKGYTEITKDDEDYRGIKKELKPIVKQQFKEQKLNKRFPREGYYTGNKTYKPSQEFLDQVTYQAAHKGEDKMGDTDVLVNMIYDDLNLQGFDIGTNTGTRKQRKLAQRLEHSPAWYAANALKERDALGVSMPKYAPGGAYGPGDDLKKFLRKIKDNTWLTANYGKLNTNATNYVPTIGLNTITGSTKKGFHDFNTNIGGDKRGLAANLKYQYYGPFMSGQRNFQGSAGAEAYYDQDKYGVQFFAGPNIPLGASAKNRDDELRRGRFRFDINPNLNVSMWDQIGDTQTHYYQPAPNQPIVSTEVSVPAKLDWGYGLDAKGEYRFKKIPLSLFGRASYQADLVRDANSSAAQYTPSTWVTASSDNPDQISGQFGPDDQIYTIGPDYVGNTEVISESEDKGWKTDNKFNFTLGARYNLDDLRFNNKNKSKKKIKKLEENDPYYNPGVRNSQGSIEGVNEELDEQKHGGFIFEADLTPEEADKYRIGGYVLEELKEGGEDDIVRPHGDSYEYKTVNGKYYTRKRESEWKNGEQPGWNLATGNAAEAIKYKVFKEERPKTKTAYDPNDSSNFESRYNNEFKLDQGIDNTANNYYQVPTLNLNGTDPDAEYNAYVAAKPQYKRTPSWMDKNVFEPIGDLYDKFQKTSLGPIDDAANLVNDIFVKPAVNLAVDTYNDPNKVAGEVMQMIVDGVQAPSKILAEDIYTTIINPEAEFDWNNIGSEKSLQRAGEIATILPMVPNVFGTATKTANVANKVDDVVNVANKTKKTIPRPIPSTTVKGSKEYIKNFKPKKTLQLESADMKFDRALADINRKSSDNPILTRVFNEGEFADDLSGLKVENTILADGTNYGRRTKHFGARGEGASMQMGDGVYNNMYIGNVDDISSASGAHLRDFHAGDTYFYTPNKTFTLSDEGVYLTSDPKTYERLYKSGKKVKLEPGVFDDTKNLDEFISADDKKILKDYSNYYEKNPSKVGSKKISTKDVNRNPGPQFNQINQAGHQYDILSELEHMETIPFMVSEGRNARAALTYAKNDKLNPLFKLDPRYSAKELADVGYDISFYNQWVNLPKKVRQAELDKLVNFYVDNVLTGKVSPPYRGGASQYQEDFIRVIDELQMLHDKAGPGLKYKKGGYIEVELSDEEVEQYRAGGYILEELVNGGEDDVVRPHGDPYEYKKVGDKYYTRKREGEYDQEYPAGEGPMWTLASGEAEDGIKYNVFKEQKPEPVVEDPFYTYDPNNPKNFDSRYWNDIKLDQSQDGLKPQYFAASNLPLLGLDGTDPDAGYKQWVANRPLNKRAPSWFDKNVIEPVSDLYDKFQKTSLGPVDDAANLVNDAFIQPVVDLATDTYNDPNKVAGEVMQMMVDGVTLPFDAGTEAIYSGIINPDAEFNTSVLGDPKSLERFGQIAAVAPAIPSVFGTTAKTAAVTNKVDDVVNVAKKTISRPKPSTTTAMAETSSGNVVPVNSLQSVKNSRYMKGSDGKTYLRESEYNNFTGTRKANLDKKIASGEVEVLRQTPDGNAYLLSDKSIANIDTTVKAKLDRMKTDKGRQLTFEQEKAYIKKEFPEMDEASINQAANQAVDARIAEVESLYKNKNYQEAYYDLEEMNAHMEIGDDVIKSTQYQPEQVTNFDKTVNPVNQNANMRFHPNLADDSAIVSHEAGHIANPGRNLPIEDEILNAVGSPKNLSAQDQVAYDYLVETSKRRQKLIDDMRNHDPSNANLSEAELIDKYSNLGQSKGDIFTGDYTFANNIKKVQQLSSEVLPYAQELKQVLLDRGLIDDWFDEITPEILTKAKKSFSEKPSGFYQADMLGNVENATSTTRLLDITDPSRYQQLSNSLNKIAPVAVPAAAVGTGTMMNEQDGGFIERELTAKQVEQYRLGGYIVEEIQ